MLLVKEAVQQSVRTFTELYLPETFRDLRLEEVSISEDEQTWQVTLSYKNPDYKEELQTKDDVNSSLLRLGGWTGPATRNYKIVTINALDGSFLSVKNAR